MKFKFKHKKVSPFISCMLLFFIFFALLAGIFFVYRQNIDKWRLEQERRDNAKRFAPREPYRDPKYEPLYKYKFEK